MSKKVRDTLKHTGKSDKPSKGSRPKQDESVNDKLVDWIERRKNGRKGS